MVANSELSDGGKITEVRLRFGLTDKDLATLIHCPYGAIRLIEGGRRKLTEHMRDRLDQLLISKG